MHRLTSALPARTAKPQERWTINYWNMFEWKCTFKSVWTREPVRSYKNCLRSLHCMPSDSSVSQGVYWATLRRSLLGLVKFSKKQCNLNNMSTQHIIAKCLLEFNTNFYYFTVNRCHVFNWFFNTTTLVDTVNNSYSTDKFWLKR